MTARYAVGPDAFTLSSGMPSCALLVMANPSPDSFSHGGQPPAILKGWIDRVFRPGVAYDYPKGVGPEAPAVGLLRAKAALVFNTSNTPEERESSLFGNPLESLWKDCIFGLCGLKGFERRVFWPMASSTPAQRDAWLAEVRDVVSRHA